MNEHVEMNQEQLEILKKLAIKHLQNKREEKYDADIRHTESNGTGLR